MPTTGLYWILGLAMVPAKRKGQAKYSLPLAAGENFTKQRDVSDGCIDAIGGDNGPVEINGAIGLSDQAFGRGPELVSFEQ